MAAGVVKFFNAEKNFGFIVPDVDGADVFVHADDVVGAILATGEHVSYELVAGYGSPKATNVRRTLATALDHTDAPPDPWDEPTPPGDEWEWKFAEGLPDETTREGRPRPDLSSLDPWDAGQEMESSGFGGGGGYGLFDETDLRICSDCGYPAVVGHHRCRVDGRLFGHGRAFIRDGHEHAAMGALASGAFEAERFILSYRDGYWREYLARFLTLDEGHFTVWVDFNLVPDREELLQCFGVEEVEALEVARWMDGDLRQASRDLSEDDKRLFLTGVAEILGVDVDDDSQEDDEGWDGESVDWDELPF